MDVLPVNDDVVVSLIPVLFVQKAHGMHELVHRGSQSGQTAGALEIQFLRAPYAPDGGPAAGVLTDDQQVVLVVALSRHETDARILVVLIHRSIDHRHVTVTFRSGMKTVVIRVRKLTTMVKYTVSNCFMDFIHHLSGIKNTTFRKMVLVLSSDERRTKPHSVGPPGRANFKLGPRGPRDQAIVLVLPEDGKIKNL
jgi:hypothetical protein